MKADLKNVGKGEINLTNPSTVATVMAQDRESVIFIFGNIIYQRFEGLHDLLYFRGTIGFASDGELWELDFSNGKWFDATVEHLEHVSFIDQFDEVGSGDTVIVM